MIRLYGISNCDTVRKAKKWLDQHNVPYSYHDLRKDGLNEAQLDRWLRAVGWEALLNRRGLSWRRLNAEDRADMDAAKARSLMLRNPTLIRRPVAEYKGEVRVGFTPHDYALWLSNDA